MGLSAEIRRRRVRGRVKLRDGDADDRAGLENQREAEALLERNKRRIFDLQEALYAERRRALLVVLQGTDTSGKDGTIRHVFSGVNPQGCRVTSFKVPSADEAAHDFLWRVHREVPARGLIGVFNRSHYEDVLVVRVHGLVPKDVWKRRYGQINRFEEHLAENGVRVIKFFLHVSRDEQEKRLEARRRDPRKRWKVNPGDEKERRFWGRYREAYEDALERCSTPEAPWFVVPADRKWVRNAFVSQAVADTLEDMDPRFPGKEKK